MKLSELDVLNTAQDVQAMPAREVIAEFEAIELSEGQSIEWIVEMPAGTFEVLSEIDKADWPFGSAFKISTFVSDDRKTWAQKLEVTWIHDGNHEGHSPHSGEQFLRIANGKIVPFALPAAAFWKTEVIVTKATAALKLSGRCSVRR